MLPVVTELLCSSISCSTVTHHSPIQVTDLHMQHSELQDDHQKEQLQRNCALGFKAAWLFLSRLKKDLSDDHIPVRHNILKQTNVYTSIVGA